MHLCCFTSHLSPTDVFPLRLLILIPSVVVVKISEMYQQSLCMNLNFRLEGDVPTLEKTETQMLGGVPGFATPQLPRPGQRVTKKNALRIEK